jgi:invasion protein IalB
LSDPRIGNVAQRAALAQLLLIFKHVKTASLKKADKKQPHGDWYKDC